MPKNPRKPPRNDRYSSFDMVGLGGEVHLRLVDEEEDVPPTYVNAKMTALSGKPGEQLASFWIPSLRQTVPNISEKQYTAWTRY